MEQSEDSITSKRPNALLIGGFLIVIVLIIAGLFLPPVSLGKRLGLGADGDGVETAAEPEQRAQEGATETGPEMQETRIAFTQFAESEEWASAADALPDMIAVTGDVYLATSQTAGQPFAMSVPADSGALETLDLYAWNGVEWVFLPSRLDTAGQQIVVTPEAMALTSAQAILAVHAAAPEALAVGAEVLPTQNLPTEILPLLTEVTAGTLTLAESGALQGDLVSIPTGPYDQLMRVTNTGAIIDQVSLSALLADVTAQTNQISELLAEVQEGNYIGVNLDFQGVPLEQSKAFTSYVAALADALHSEGHSLTITFATPRPANGGWDTGGQDWAALGQLADAVHLQMPLDPAAYGDGGTGDQLIAWATRQVSRAKITMLLSAFAVDRIGESYLEMSNDRALANFGELQFVQGGPEVQPSTEIEVALSGTASPLEWDGNSLTYKYTYDLSGQTHQIWLASEAALSHRLRFAHRYLLRGIAVRGLGQVTDGEGFATTLASFLGTADAPQPEGAAVVWTVRTEDGSVLASNSGDALSFMWEGTEEPGAYSINADFALGETIASLGALDVAVMAPEEEIVIEEEAAVVIEEEEKAEQETAETTPAESQDTSPVAADPGDADAIVNVNANVRVGPGLTYGTIAGGLTAGSRVSVLGRNADASWIHILMPDGETKGWIFGSLITLNAAINVSALEVIEVEPPTVASGGNGGGGGGGGETTAPPPVSAPPVTNSGFELGGQTHSLANPSLMSYAGMKWVKFQHKWNPGDSPDAVAGRIQQAHANGFKVLLSIPGAQHGSIDFNAYVNFLGGVAALGPDAIEIWNEMNIDREWPAGQINPASYVNNMLAPAYNAIKAARSSVMVISGAPAPTGFFGGCGGGGCNDDLYMTGMAAAGAASYMDCIGIHYNEGIISPNQTSGDPRNPSNHYTRYFWGMVNTYWNAFGGARPLCFTELGYLSGADYGGLPGGFSWAGGTSIAQHAQWLAEAASLSASSGKVRLMIVFNVDFTHYSSDPQAGYAMIRADGSCPACETLRQVMGGG